MDVSQNSLEMLELWEDEIIRDFKSIKEWDEITHDKWKQIEPMYYIIKFWIGQKKRDIIKSLKPTFEINSAKDMRSIYLRGD